MRASGGPRTWRSDFVRSGSGGGLRGDARSSTKGERLGHRLRRTHRLRPTRNRRRASSRFASSSPAQRSYRPSTPSDASQTRAPRRASPPRGGCPVGRCGRRELDGRQALVGCRARKGVVWVVADPAGRTSASEPRATEARPRRGAELEAMIDLRGLADPFTRRGLVPSSSRATPSRGSGGHRNATASHRGRRTHPTAADSASGTATFRASSDRASRPQSSSYRATA